jgi:hypothetical protein
MQMEMMRLSRGAIVDDNWDKEVEPEDVPEPTLVNATAAHSAHESDVKSSKEAVTATKAPADGLSASKPSV